MLVAGFHLIWTAYGWWLPNDPRGSSSEEIRVEKIKDLGELHHGRKKIQPRRREVLEFYDEASEVLKHPLLLFQPDDFPVIADAFRRAIAQEHYTCYKCAIMPDHVHILIRKHKQHAEEMVEKLQAESKRQLLVEQRRESTHPVWGGPGWKVFLYNQDDFRRVIDYIHKNPLKIGLPAQHWDFVKAYDGWLPGHWVNRTR
jgi:REP element-mobilizing transposase RayT